MVSSQDVRQNCPSKLDQPLLDRLLDKPLVCWHQVDPSYTCAHHHPGVEYLYINRGSGVFLTGKHWLPFTAPVLLSFQSEVPHGIKVWGAYERWSMCYLPEVLRTALPTGRCPTTRNLADVEMTHVPENHRKRLSDLFSALLFERDTQSKFSYEVIGLHLQELGYIFERFRDTSAIFARKDGANYTRPSSNERVTMLLGLIEARLDENLAVDELATLIHYSRSQLYRIIREATGLPYAGYIRQRRIERAKQLLRVTDLPISDIAMRIGMPQLPQFYRAFRELTNTTPKEYRSVYVKSS